MRCIQLKTRMIIRILSEEVLSLDGDNVIKKAEVTIPGLHDYIDQRLKVENIYFKGSDIVAMWNEQNETK